MKRGITFILLICCFYQFASSSEVNRRVIKYHERIPLLPSFINDTFSYGFFDPKPDKNGIITCTVYRVNDIFGKTDETKKCDIEMKNMEVTKHSQIQPLSSDHAIILTYDDFVAIRFDDCKYFQGNSRNYDRVENKKKFMDFGIDLEGLFTGGTILYSNTHKESTVRISAAAPFDGKGNQYSAFIYNMTSRPEKVNRLSSMYSDLLAKDHLTQRFVYNKNGELKFISGLGSNYLSYWSNGAHGYITLMTMDFLNNNTYQINPNGEILLTIHFEHRSESILGLHDLPGGGFYMITMPRKIPNGLVKTRLSKVNVKGERTIVQDLSDVMRISDDLSHCLLFEHENGQLCMRTVQYNMNLATGTLVWLTKCFEDIQISE